MTALDLIRRLHQHRLWAAKNLRESAGQVQERLLRLTFPIGQGSIWKTLVHLMGADYVWLEALLGNEAPVLPGDLPGQLPGNQLGQGGVKDLSDLNAFWDRLDVRWREYLDQLTEEQLAVPVRKLSTSSGAGKVYETARTDVLLHLCTHSQYTVAQGMNMLRHAGLAKLPEVMLITMARLELPGV